MLSVVSIKLEIIIIQLSTDTHIDAKTRRKNIIEWIVSCDNSVLVFVFCLPCFCSFIRSVDVVVDFAVVVMPYKPHTHTSQSAPPLGFSSLLFIEMPRFNFLRCNQIILQSVADFQPSPPHISHFFGATLLQDCRLRLSFRRIFVSLVRPVVCVCVRCWCLFRLHTRVNSRVECVCVLCMVELSVLMHDLTWSDNL